MGMVAELDIKVGIQYHADDLREQLIRPDWHTKRALFAVFFGYVGPSRGLPLIPFGAQCFDNGINFVQSHGVRSFVRDSRRQCASVPVDFAICCEVQIAMKQLSVDPFEWETSFASLLKKSQIRFGTLHYACLSV